mgnify:CR=1 FL=1
MCRHACVETIQDEYYDNRLKCRTQKNTADLHFLWKDRKRGEPYERPATAGVTVFLQASEMTRGTVFLFYLLSGIDRPTNRKRAVYKC